MALEYQLFGATTSSGSAPHKALFCAALELFQLARVG